LQVGRAVFLFEDDKAVVLGQIRGVTNEFTVDFIEASIDVEDLLGVDCVALAWAKVIVDIVEEDVDRALAVMVAAFEHAIRARSITAMSCRTIGMSVGLHQIKLGAVMATDFRTIAVLERIIIIVNCRHHDSV